jgi:hypothetical protein
VQGVLGYGKIPEWEGSVHGVDSRRTSWAGVAPRGVWRPGRRAAPLSREAWQRSVFSHGYFTPGREDTVRARTMRFAERHAMVQAANGYRACRMDGVLCVGNLLTCNGQEWNDEATGELASCSGARARVDRRCMCYEHSCSDDRVETR